MHSDIGVSLVKLLVLSGHSRWVSAVCLDHYRALTSSMEGLRLWDFTGGWDSMLYPSGRWRAMSLLLSPPPPPLLLLIFLVVVVVVVVVVVAVVVVVVVVVVHDCGLCFDPMSAAGLSPCR